MKSYEHKGIIHSKSSDWSSSDHSFLNYRVHRDKRNPVKISHFVYVHCIQSLIERVDDWRLKGSLWSQALARSNYFLTNANSCSTAKYSWSIKQECQSTFFTPWSFCRASDKISWFWELVNCPISFSDERLEEGMACLCFFPHKAS